MSKKHCKMFDFNKNMNEDNIYTLNNLICLEWN